MKSQTLRIIVAAGGTGGDLFPAIAMIEHLQTLMKVEALFVGNPDRIEAREAPRRGFEFEPLSIRGYKGLRSLQSYALPFSISASTLKVRSLIKRFKPQVALCAGTYISFPLAIAASWARLPLVLIESNAIPGKANRSVARRADLIVAAFEECKKYFREEVRSRVRVFGNPIRHSFSELPSRSDAAAVFSFDPTMKTLFVFGGSLGARSINTAVQQSFDLLEQNKIQVIWQTGMNAALPSSIPTTVHPYPFLDDMASAYAASDLVVSRSGGGTVAELKVVGKPALLIPYPYAANNEQEFNALALQDQGAAIMIRDAEIRERFALSVLDLLLHPDTLSQMSQSMQSLARPNAAADAAHALLELIKIV